jgi:hypothetical protein
MSRKSPHTEQLNRRERNRLNEEVALARALQAFGMTRSDALRAAAEHVAQMDRSGRVLGNIVGQSVSVKREGDNGGPPLTD